MPSETCTQKRKALADITEAEALNKRPRASRKTQINTPEIKRKTERREMTTAQRAIIINEALHEVPLKDICNNPLVNRPKSTVSTFIHRAAAQAGTTPSQFNLRNPDLQGKHSELLSDEFLESKPRSGAPYKFTDDDVAVLINECTKDGVQRRKHPFEVYQEIQNAANSESEHPSANKPPLPPASRSTVDRTMDFNGYDRFFPRYKPALDDDHKKRRLAFAIEHRKKTVKGFWRFVLFTDEMAFTQGKPYHRKKVTRQRGKREEWIPECTTSRNGERGTTIPFAGGIAINMKTKGHVFRPEPKEETKRVQAWMEEENRRRHEEADKQQPNRRKNSAPKYVKLERNHANIKRGVDWYRYEKEALIPLYLPAYKELDDEAKKHGKRAVLMEDGAETHHVRHHDEYHDEYNVVRMGKYADVNYIKEKRRKRYRFDWPPYSPDINPIEHVWEWMKDWIDKMEPHRPKTVEEARNALYAAWDAVPFAIINKFIENIPHILEKIIEHEGGNDYHG
ncbi:hypothetical protein BJ508DRAFT_331167 [Ascobolus immersus RN42]|uniref:Tc1-like transposase DDE domain-containing protein n=1 Tax=Ascobolus immersus RN42 TaxID=1160509 RepID=A0A3N4HWP3_ASCIM|nr:hypothetical protein BJ508DRAFT_331167 [Ascobolus immersus RN42]